MSKLLRRFPKFHHFRLLGIIVIPLLFVVIAVSSYFFIFKDLPSPHSLQNYKVIPIASQIYDRNGKLLYEIYKDEKRTAVKLDTLPKYVSQATIAIEDKDFYSHGGVSIVSGVLRAVKEDLSKKKLQGGSTLTQQLVKNALLNQDRTIRRKLREIVLAIWTEQVFKKNQILEMYLNQVSYGGEAFGIQEASRTYYGKDAKDLTLAEAALLAGLPQAPSLYSPFVDPEAAIQRRNLVLKNMRDVKEHYITNEQYEKAVKEPLHVIKPKTEIKAPHFVFYIKQQLEKMYGAQMVEEGGLKVTTTLDLDYQEEAEKIVKDKVEAMKNLKVGNGAVLATRPATGEIIVMVGSKDYFDEPYGAFNVTTARRQPGSSIKPLNFAVGIERHLVNAATVFLDIPTCFSGGPKKYCPQNYDGKFHGPVQLRFGLANSYNIPAVKMLELNGVEPFVASAEAMGLDSLAARPLDTYGLSLTLGAADVKMTEMAQAFGSFANRGINKPLVAILKIEDKTGKVLYEFKDPNFVKDIKQPLRNPNFLLIDGKRVLSPETSFIMSHILSDNYARSATFGTGSALVIPGKTVSVKTGTTDDKKDNLTIGYTPNFLVDVWVGNNDSTPMSPYVESGETGAAPIWNAVMKVLLKNQPDLRLVKPSGVVDRWVCSLTGQVQDKNDDASKGCTTRFEYFIKGTENLPQVAVQTSRETIPVNKNTGKQTNPNDPDLEMREQTVIKTKDGLYCMDCAH
jgi:1A family penicillin-binding protein